MKKHLLGVVLLFCTSIAIHAQLPDNYYASIDGKKEAALKAALYSIIQPKTPYSYKTLFSAYEKIDYVEGSKNSSGQYLVFDYYSEVKHYFPGGGDAPSGMNKEHTVPQSWWSGSPGCYNDVFQVLPSDATANSSKGNYPLGVVTGSVSYSNQRMKTGKGSDNKMVFEPIDEYKGDFARIYFYVATCYPDASWQNRSDVNVAMKKEAYPTLKAEFQTLLLKWNEQDPVSEWEMTRQERAYKVQGNRNPFIDYPDLANYIWGRKKDIPFDLSTAELHVIPVDPDNPPVDPDDPPVDPDDPPVDPDNPGINVGDELFHETFADCTEGNNTTNSGQSATWAGNDQIVSVDRAYQAGGAVKLGSSSKSGSITTAPIQTDGGDLVVLLDVKGWTSVEGKLNVTLGSQRKSVEYTATMTDAFQTLQLLFNNVEANPSLTIATETKRCFIDDLRVCTYKEETATSLTTLSEPVFTTDVPTYDLYGRKVTGPLPTGIYIRGGRKILIR